MQIDDVQSSTPEKRLFFFSLGREEFNHSIFYLNPHMLLTNILPFVWLARAKYNKLRHRLFLDLNRSK